MRPLTREDDYEYNVKRILRQFHKDWRFYAPDMEFGEYLWKNAKEIGQVFLNNTEEYLDINELFDEGN